MTEQPFHKSDFTKEDLDSHKIGFEEVDRLNDKMAKKYGPKAEEKPVVESMADRARRRMGLK